MKWQHHECITVAQREALIQMEARVRKFPVEDLRALTTRAGVLHLKDGRRLIRDARWYLQTPAVAS